MGLSLLGYTKYSKFFEPFENRLNDAMFLIRGDRKADERIIIIDIDEKSLKRARGSGLGAETK